jgi:hypothetical protein
MHLRYRCQRQGCPGRQRFERTNVIAWLSKVGVTLTRIGLEVGRLPQGFMRRCGRLGSPMELLETRHVRNVFKMVKTDRKDANQCGLE